MAFPDYVRAMSKRISITSSIINGAAGGCSRRNPQSSQAAERKLVLLGAGSRFDKNCRMRRSAINVAAPFSVHLSALHSLESCVARRPVPPENYKKYHCSLGMHLHMVPCSSSGTSTSHTLLVRSHYRQHCCASTRLIFSAMPLTPGLTRRTSSSGARRRASPFPEWHFRPGAF